MAATNNVRYSQIRSGDRKGNGSQIQMFGGGATVNGHVAIYDAGGNVIDSGAAPSTGGDFSKITLEPPLVADFSGGWFNQGTATATDQTDGIAFVFPNSAASPGIRGLIKTAPSTPYTIEVFYRAITVVNGNAIFGVCWSNGTNYVTWGSVLVNAQPRMDLWYVTGFNSINGQDSETFNVTSGGFWLRFSDDGTTRRMYVSGDGRNWLEIGLSQGHAAFITPTQVGVFGRCETNALKLLAKLMHWKVY